MRSRLSYDQFTQRRIRKVLWVLAVGYILLAIRLFCIQVVRSPYFKALAEEQTVREIRLPARRGAVYDRNGKKLAISVDAYDIGVRPLAIRDKAAIADRLCTLLGCNYDKLLANLEERRRFFYVARGVDVEIGDKIREARLPGVDPIRTTKRVYPGNSLAAHIVGFTNVDGKGMEGLEKSYDEVLRGRDGYVIVERDARGFVIPGSKRKRVEPIDGNDLVLTIDSTLQHALETSLAESYERWAAVGASAVMIDPKTGEILALANMPTYDLNKVSASDISSRRNRAVTDLYEPGSTLKTITACAALEEGAIDTDDTFHCSGSMRIGRRTVRCSLHPPFMDGHGSCDVARILRYSCNMGAAGIGMRLGKEKLYSYEEKFGLYEKPGSGLPGEVSGWHDQWQDWADVRLANIAFGQGIVVTPMQLARAYSAVANDGMLMQPFVVREIRRPNGTVLRSFEPKTARRVVSERTAGLVSEMLHGVVTQPHGTGKPARVDGYTVGGKTGSAQKASTTGRGYVAGKFVASFVGFLPVSDPRVVVLVAVDEPKGRHWGAVVAAPVFQAAAQKAMWHMKVPPDDAPRPSSPVANEGSNEQGINVGGHPSGMRLRG